MEILLPLQDLQPLLATLFLLLLCVVLLLNVFSLPGNWIAVGLVVMWRFLNPASGNMDTLFFVGLVGVAVFGEVIEFVAQAWGAKRYGSTTGGMWAGIVGALVGAILGVPFLFGLGALIGALAGAWLGCYALERARGRSDAEASRAARGAVVGRFSGLVIKCGIGVVLLWMVYNAIWPGLPPSPDIMTL